MICMQMIKVLSSDQRDNLLKILDIVVIENEEGLS